MTIKEEPPGHLPQRAHHPSTTIQERHKNRILFRKDGKHRQSEARIQKRQTTYHPQTPKEVV